MNISLEKTSEKADHRTFKKVEPMSKFIVLLKNPFLTNMRVLI